MLRDIAAVDFLTQLSPNVEPRLRAVIDETLDQLCHLPDLLPSQAMAYLHVSHTGDLTGVASNSQIFFFSFRFCLLLSKSDQRFKVCVQYCLLKCLIVVCDALFAIFLDKEELSVGYFHTGEPSQTDVPPQRIAGTAVSKEPCVPSFLSANNI